MAIDPARHMAQIRALRGEEPQPEPQRKRPPARSCPGCRRKTRDASGTCPRCQAVEERRVVESLSVEQLQQIIEAARAELARRAAAISVTLESP